MMSRRSTKCPCDIPATTQSRFAPREGFFYRLVCDNVVHREQTVVTRYQQQ
jgi:hypothetical protein